LIETMDDVTQEKQPETMPITGDNETNPTGDLLEGEEISELPASTIDDRLQAAQAELAAAQGEAADYKDRWMRAVAESQNIRRRAERERTELILGANERLLQRILPVVDDFDLAFAHVPVDLSEQDQGWLNGFALIQRKLQSVLSSEGVVAIETAGMTFDPTQHEAVTYEVAAGFTENQIIGEVRKGYLLGERVLRPAMVRVARAG
jgi:molecular chaperone GrpE